MPLRGLRDEELQSMDKRWNNAFELYLNNEDGVLKLNGLLINTMVYLYDEQGNLRAKDQCTEQTLLIQLPSRGAYVLVLLHPSCEVMVRKLFF